mgnify:CR=1 FL=1|jgi:hypothetical protein|tara:strand:+ start:17841 stop:18227 length:387 start_codon:yes stop_codon:yes gene_type:complete
MDLEVRQAIFYSFLRTIFNDKSHAGINNQNCAGFYHFILAELNHDCDMYLNADNDEKYFFFQTVVNLIEDFNEMAYSELKEIIHSRRHFIQYLIRETPVVASKYNTLNISRSLEFKYAVMKTNFLKSR